ncbi:MAG: 3'-5' exoribonuclease [Clostridiales bacterium]|nr:3'-5' exoribonuclease [Clostridiales bacterium]
MKYTVIDFETANSKRSSACALGIVVVENGRITEEMAYLIKPSDMYFEGMNIGIHGIYPEDVINEPTFDILYEQVFKKYLENQLVVAHNASFDMSVLRACLNEYDIPFPSLDYLCTVKIAQKLWPDLPKHSLDVVSGFLSFKFRHHDAFDDARACANIMITGCFEQNKSPYELAQLLNIKVGKLFLNGYKPCSSRK